ncbi:Regulatory protein MIG1 [Termitomyces sp. T112]|nr:Regulatory protein MIG1 [Termitomyces sp. T112]
MGGEHKCPVCDATFTRPQHVARHMRSHTGDRPYRCQFCPDQFARSDLLSRHVNKAHHAHKPAGPPGRKASRAALRATSSKQSCDQCVRSSHACDGAKPCAPCSQRQIRCTFVDFHRQTAPEGPGHPDQPAPPDLLYMPTPAQQQMYPWNQAYTDQSFMSSYDHRDYPASVASGSSASSSSSHLPVDDSFQFNTAFDTYQPPPEDLQAPFGVLSIHDPDAAPFFSSQQPVVGTTMIGDPNATPMSRDDLTWTHLLNTPVNVAHATPTPTGIFRRRAASMFNVRTPIAAPQAFLHPDHGALSNQRMQQPDQRQQPIYGAMHMPVPVEDLSSWSAKIESQPPPELRLAAAKVKARRQTLSGGERDCERNSQLLHPAPTPILPFRPTDTQGKMCFVDPTSFTDYRDSTSPVDPHTRSSSSSTASWESTSESRMRRPSFKRLPSETPLEHDRERKRVLVSYPAGSGLGSGESIGDTIALPLQHNPEHGLVSYNNPGHYGSAEGVTLKIEDGESSVGGTAGPTRSPAWNILRLYVFFFFFVLVFALLMCGVGDG